MKIEQLKEKFLKVPSNRSKLIVKNKLSQKPQSAVNNLRQFVESQKVYNVTMFQDYSTNTVNFNLVGKCYYLNRDPKKADLFDQGHIIYQSRKLPATSTVKNYKKLVQDMFDAQVEEKLKPKEEVKKSFFSRVCNIIHYYFIR